MRIAVVGPSTADDRITALAYEVGKLLAQQGCTVYSGGLGGVMEAVCRGASEAGGATIGVLPGSDAGEANPYVNIPIATGMGEARNLVLISSTEVVIAIGKGYGTLSEVAFALRLAKPVILLESWAEIAGQARTVSSPEEAVQAAISMLPR